MPLASRFRPLIFLGFILRVSDFPFFAKLCLSHEVTLENSPLPPEVSRWIRRVAYRKCWDRKVEIINYRRNSSMFAA